MSKSIICTVTNDLNQDRRMQKVCSALHEAGYNVTLVGREKPDSQKLLDLPYSQVRLPVKNVRGPRFYFEYNQALYKLISQRRPDAVYAVDTDTLWGCGRGASKTNARFIIDMHEYFTEVPELMNRRFKKKVWQTIEQKYIPLADLRFTVGASLQKMFAEKYEVPFHLVRNIPPFKSLIPAEKKPIILYQGVLNEGRGLSEMIAALHYIKDQQLSLHIVGGGDIEHDLRQQSLELVRKGKVVFRGWKYGEALDEITASAWLGINLLESKSLNYYYSLANKFFDYMNAGIPSLNSKLPEYETILSEHPIGITIEGLNPSNIAQTINELRSDSQRYDSMVIATELAKKHFQWSNEKKVLLEQISKIF